MGTDNYVITVLSGGLGGAPPVGLANRLKTVSGRADAFAAIAESLYASSVRAQVLAGLNAPALQRQIGQELNRRGAARDAMGVLVVIKAWVVQTSAGPRYSDIVVYAGPAAPSVGVALAWEARRPKIWPSHGSAGGVQYDYLWLAPDGGMARAGLHQMPKDVCVVSEWQYDDAMSPH